MQAVFFPAKTLEYPLVSAEDVARFDEEQKRIDELQKPWKEQLKQLEQPYRDRLMEEKKAKLPDYIQLALQDRSRKAHRRPEAERDTGGKDAQHRAERVACNPLPAKTGRSMTS